MIYFFILFLLFINPHFCHANITLNEIYPAPLSGEYEWIELYNTEDRSIDISQYQLFDIDGHKIKISTESVSPFGFVLATSSAVLNNTGDTVLLKNNSGEILEIATYSGSFDSTKSFIKCPDGGTNWISLNIITKNTFNEVACLSLTPTVAPSPILVNTEIPTPTNVPVSTPTTMPVVDYDSIFISEVYPYPQKGEEEWVELYNSGENEAILTDWKIDDVENGGSSPHSFNLTIPSKQYSTVSFSSSLFNNEGDSVRLLNFSGVEKDDMEYVKAIEGLSFGRQSIEDDTYCIQLASPNNINNNCREGESHTYSQTKTVTSSPSIKKIVPTSKLLLNTTKKGEQSGLFVQNTSSEVLGEMTKLVDQSPSPSASPYLLAVSTSYALLTLVSVFVKMKYADNS